MVVSEERGKFSILDKGKYRQVDDPEKLERTIIAHWKRTSSYPFELPEANGKEKGIDVITTPIYLESIYNDTSLFCKIIAPPSFQPADKRWPDVEVVIKVGP